MAKRLVICDVIGNGTRANPYRAAVASYGIAFVAPIHSDPVTGAPTHTRTLAMIGAPTAAELQACLADPAVRVIPFGRLDDPLSSFTAAQRQAIRDAAAEFGLDTSVYTGATLLGRVVRDIGRAIDPNFLEDARHFDIGGVAD